MMKSIQHHVLPASLLLMTLMMPTWSSSSSAAVDNNISRSRDNSLLGFSSKSTLAAVKNPKAHWPVSAVVGGSTGPDRVKTFPASWTPTCRNSSCPTPGPSQTEPAELLSVYPAPAGQDVFTLMRAVSEELSGLHSALQHLKLYSQAVHRQIKRLHRETCATVRRARRRTRRTRSDEQQDKPQDTGTYSLLSC